MLKVLTPIHCWGLKPLPPPLGGTPQLTNQSVISRRRIFKSFFLIKQLVLSHQIFLSACCCGIFASHQCRFIPATCYFHLFYGRGENWRGKELFLKAESIHIHSADGYSWFLLQPKRHIWIWMVPILSFSTLFDIKLKELVVELVLKQTEWQRWMFHSF